MALARNQFPQVSQDVLTKVVDNTKRFSFNFYLFIFFFVPAGTELEMFSKYLSFILKGFSLFIPLPLGLVSPLRLTPLSVLSSDQGTL